MKTARIERNGTGIEKNGASITSFIEKNGTGIERNGTGIARFIERNGTGIRHCVARAAVIGALLFGFAVSASADVRGFVEVSADTVRLTLADDIAVLTGSGTQDLGYARVALGGVSCGGHSSVLIEGNGTGAPQIEGNGTGKTQIEGNGTGRTQIEGNGTGRTQIEGNGTGRTQIEGNGTGAPLIEGNGTGSPNAATGSFVAEIAVNGQTASVIVYGIRANGSSVELAVLEVPVIAGGMIGREAVEGKMQFSR